MKHTYDDLPSPEKRLAERDAQRKIKLFYRFKNSEDKQRALDIIAEFREFQEELKQVDSVGSDQSPEHSGDGIVLHMGQYTKSSLESIKNFFISHGLEVTGCNEWIEEPEEQQAHAEEMAGYEFTQGLKPSNVIEMKPKSMQKKDADEASEQIAA